MTLSRGRIVLILLAVLLAFSAWWSIRLDREKRQLAQSYTQAQQMVQQLEQERVHLDTELGEARQTIEGQAGEVGGLKAELEDLQQRLEQTTTELAALQQEHQHLRQQHSSVSAQLESVSTEKRQLEAKLSSIKELKLAIRDVKRKMWNERLAGWRAHIEASKIADQEQLAVGNRGFIVRQGTPTLGSRNQLQVRVLEPQVQ